MVKSNHIHIIKLIRTITMEPKYDKEEEAEWEADKRKDAGLDDEPDIPE